MINRLEYFQKDRSGYYLSMSESIAEGLGVEGGVYHPDMRLAPGDIVPLAGIADNILAEDYGLRKSQAVSNSQTWVRCAKEGDWVHSFIHAHVMDNGSIVGHSIRTRGQALFGAWPSRLNFKEEVLATPWGAITRREMRVLRMMLDGVPRAKMGELLFVSIKSIEKYISKLRGQLTASLKLADNYMDIPLLQVMNDSGLTQFLLGHNDWFSHEGQHTLIPQ